MQIIGRRTKHIREIAPQILPAIPILIDRVFEERGRHELHLPHGAGPGAFKGGGGHVSLLYDAQRIEQLPLEEVLSPPFPGQGSQGRYQGEITGQFTEIGFDAPQGDNKTGLHPIFLTYFREQRQMLAI
ncbi:hypothetical protein D3C79_739920 [compost metagenome]